MRYSRDYLPPEDREEYVSKVSNNLSDLSPARDENGHIYDDSMPMSYSGFPDSIFLFGRVLTMIALIIGLPVLIVSFAETVAGYSIILIIFIVLHAVCKVFNYSFSRY